MPGGDGVSEYTDETGDEGGLAGVRGLAGAGGLTGAGEAGAEWGLGNAGEYGSVVPEVEGWDKMWVRLGIGATKGGSNGWVDK